MDVLSCVWGMHSVARYLLCGISFIEQGVPASLVIVLVSIVFVKWPLLLC